MIGFKAEGFYGITPETGVFALVTFAASWSGVAVLSRWLRARRVMDVPNERSSHSQPVPRGGGLAIVASVLLALSTAPILGLDGTSPVELLTLAGTCLLLASVSFADDLFDISNRVRLAVQLVSAALFITAFGPWAEIRLGTAPVVVFGTFAAAVFTTIWVVGLTNAYNFMDGIDLMAAGQAVAAGIGWAALGWLSHAPLLVIIGVAIASAAAGFGLHNRPPARIFMGDVGSAFLGYLFAVTTAGIAYGHDPRLATAGALLVWPFVFDTSFTFLRRLRTGEAVFRPHRSHLYQRLVIAGMSHLQVSVLYFALDAVGIACAIALVAGLPHAPGAAAATIAASAFGLWFFVRHREAEARSRAGAA